MWLLIANSLPHLLNVKEKLQWPQNTWYKSNFSCLLSQIQQDRWSLVPLSWLKCIFCLFPISMCSYHYPKIIFCTCWDQIGSATTSKYFSLSCATFMFCFGLQAWWSSLVQTIFKIWNQFRCSLQTLLLQAPIFKIHPSLTERAFPCGLTLAWSHFMICILKMSLYSSTDFS